VNDFTRQFALAIFKKGSQTLGHALLLDNL